MRQLLQVGLLLGVVILADCGTAEARTRGRRHISSNGQFSFQVESNGTILPTYRHRGKSYIEGTLGDRYQIRVFNHTNGRVEAVVTVDGRDVITGQIGNYRKNRGYVIAPHSSVLIDGFRTSWRRVAAFRFTDKSDSYGARMGTPENVGVIGVAIFKENRPEPPQPIIQYRDEPHVHRYKSSRPSAPESDHAAEAEIGGRARSRASRPKRGQSLGTQYGEQTYSPSTNAQFQRRNRWRPNGMLAVRYDDYNGLVDLGVLPRPSPHYHAPDPEPFPGSRSGQFAPPPPRYYWD